MAAKRLNFDVTPEQESEISWLRDALGTSSNKDTILRAVRVLRVLSAATRQGGRVYIRNAEGELERLLVPELESEANPPVYLVQRPHAWRTQPWIKGTRVLAATVWRDLLTNKMSIEEAEESWAIPAGAVREAIAWCEANQELLELETLEERKRMRPPVEGPHAISATSR